MLDKILEMQAKKGRHGRLKVKGESIKYCPHPKRGTLERRKEDRKGLENGVWTEAGEGLRGQREGNAFR